ncbi:FAD-binding protein [Plantactinospora sp. S1510]|uniref:FAD-binding protein n=1 Tax=Plantactinospora alkalitolerans TaxID=2789879 RepID=A0ABS0GRU1_9ACTN|nr:D-arabinono-1,4-lactone oxidase [Plantactinospora alkalitolerans]MBF9128915.1 FAD-binding protein [Plantactinospora alkalitolerans]
MGLQWRNWSGSLRFTPREQAAPADENALRALVDRARRTSTKLRPVGSGHSSSPLVRTEDVLVSLTGLTRTMRRHEDPRLATVSAGVPLGELGEALYEAGLAMDNLGDVDVQSIAGATATGTHGTGLRFGSLSTQVAGVRMVTGTGELLDICAERNADLLPAARLSLGALGVVTRMTLRLNPTYHLRRRSWCSSIAWTLEHLHQLQRQNRNMDFYWYPRTDTTQIRTLNLRGEEPEFGPAGEPRTTETGPSHRTIPRHRELRFEEIEYAIPSEAFHACFAEIRHRVLNRHRVGVVWRILVRTVAEDDIWLSTAYGRATTTIACMQNSSLPYREYFDDVEAVFRQHDGRPHWGKRHSLTARELRGLYPQWDRFAEVRRRLDPDGVFLTPDLARLLEDG